MKQPDRRAILAGLAALGVAGTGAMAAEDPSATTVFWEDLVPGSDDDAESTFFSTLKELGYIQHGQTLPWMKQPPVGVVTSYNESVVRIPGYVVPLTMDGEGVTEGLLVPYVGACIHVPPPPANQIVFLRMKEPTPQEGLWDPIWATGLFNTVAVETDLAEVGYIMTDAATTPYED